MGSRDLRWERDKWGTDQRKGVFYGSSTQRNTRINKIGEDNETDWRKGEPRTSAKTIFPKRSLPIEDGELWSRGGQVSLITAENLLQEMAKDNYSGNISKNLLEPKIRITELLNDEKKLNLNLIMVLIKVILKDSEENGLEKFFRQFLLLVLGTSFATKRMDSLINVTLATESSTELLDLIVQFLKLSFDLFPGLVFDMFYSRVENLHLLVTSPHFPMAISDELMMYIDELRKQAASSGPEPTVNKHMALSDSLQPPDDFRDMTIFPTRGDLTDNRTSNVFLRENKEIGAYKSVDHYLDVQFRLMREDFIRPLREGIHEYKTRNYKSFDIRVYKNVTILHAIPDKMMGMIHFIQLDTSRLLKINWTESKRFLHGSLLCFSYNNFETFVLATVAQANDEDKKQGIIWVKFVDKVPNENQNYVIIESTNLFESYRHVLTRLQVITEENICMKDYLVYDKTEISMPQYLTDNTEQRYLFNSKWISPGRKDEIWPLPEDMQMNASQYDSFRRALTNELTIIQGPPGTGKTYVGLKICHCLLQNVQSRLDNFGPILVVCYTNHALDQFLEGISFFTSSIVRIGGGCKSEKIHQFKLKEVKKRTQRFSRYGHIFKELEVLEQDLDFRRNAFQSFVDFEYIEKFISMDHCLYLRVLELKNWLSGENIAEPIGITHEVAVSIADQLIREEVHPIVRAIIGEFKVEWREDGNKTVPCYHRSILKEDSVPDTSDGYTLLKGRSSNKLFKIRAKRQTKMSSKEAGAIFALDKLSIDNRWRLYRYWRSRFVVELNESTKGKENEYEELSKRFNILKLEDDENVIKDQNIIGMTTTGVAKYGDMLEKIGCRIIVVEEAAEVIESHVITSLNSRCEHLILIGDHKQLRPSPAVYELAIKYSLDLSLFERLINNNIEYSALSTQHRMRPEISVIMRFIYAELEDHKSVFCYPDVPAVRTNIFFFNHFEQEQIHEDILSYSNKFEAEFVINFCRHLLGNGVQGSRITILTLYSGQNFLFNSLINKDQFKDVTVSIVDNYQDKENDIILLSLVRSNEYERIGFLNIENRICFSLSRAKHGLYVFGNFDILIKKNKMWRKICLFLKEKLLLGKSLDMFCQNHPEKQLIITHPRDFDKYPDYGCEELCKQVLLCGHICPRYCHYMDKDHKQHKCLENCTRMCVNGHPCKERCYEDCGNCLEKMEKTIPGCNHKQRMPCHYQPRNTDCNTLCERRLQCTHKCTRRCGVDCNPCKTMIQKISARCGHSGEYYCHDDDYVCNQVCGKELSCSHICEAMCYTCFTIGAHQLCQEDCKTLLICGHVCKAKCSSSCYPCMAICCEGCCHGDCKGWCGEQCARCTAPCQWKCVHQECSKLCGYECDRDVCNERCVNGIICIQCDKGFQCYGLCGEQCRLVCSECDSDIGENALYITLWTCEHSFEVEFMDKYMFDCREIVRKKCPVCGVIINRRSSFRYMNIVRAVSSNIVRVQELLTQKVERVEYYSYYRILHLLKPQLFEMFLYYEVDNYFIVHDPLDNRKSVDAQDCLYERCGRDGSVWKHFLLSRFRCSVSLLYYVYLRLHSDHGTPCTCSINQRSSIAHLLAWMNPHHRQFNKREVEGFSTLCRKIRDVIKLCKNNATLTINEGEPKDPPNTLSYNLQSRRFNVCSPKFMEYLAITFDLDSNILEELDFSPRRWFLCSVGHVYTDENVLLSTLECPVCTGEDYLPSIPKGSVCVNDILGSLQ